MNNLFKQIRVLVVDDHRHIHTVVSKILSDVKEFKVVGHASNGEEAIQLCKAEKPDVVLMDVVMPILDGLEATRVIHSDFPDIKILVLSSFQDHESVHALLRNGAVGYITKDSLTNELVQLIKTTATGKAVLAPEVMKNLFSKPQAEQGINKFNLTDREIEVLLLLADGLQYQQIAEKLAISISTVKFHQNNIFSKLGVQTRSEALVIAVKNNLL